MLGFKIDFGALQEAELMTLLGLLEGGTHGGGCLMVAIDSQCFAVGPSTASLQDLHNSGVAELCLVNGWHQCMHFSWLSVLPFLWSE